MLTVWFVYITTNYQTGLTTSSLHGVRWLSTLFSTATLHSSFLGNLQALPGQTPDNMWSSIWVSYQSNVLGEPSTANLLKALWAPQSLWLSPARHDWAQHGLPTYGDNPSTIPPGLGGEIKGLLQTTWDRTPTLTSRALYPQMSRLYHL